MLLLFFSNKKNQLVELQNLLGRNKILLPVFGFKNGQFDLNLLNYYQIIYLINKKKVEPSVIRKANDLIRSILEKFSF